VRKFHKKDFIGNFHFSGSAVTQVITFYSMAIMTVIYILASGLYKETWGGK
jgi:hypothetical protein